MHQSGHSRAQSMHAVQFSSLSEMTPRARGAGSSRTCGYWTVAAPLEGCGIGFLRPSGKRVSVMVLAVTPRPFSTPGSLGTSEHHLEDGGCRDVDQRKRDEE